MRPFVVLALVFVGCADPALRGEVADLHHRLDETARRETVAQTKIQELEDRVFLLTDQVESQKVAAARGPAPRLPVVTLKPAESAAPDSSSANDDEAQYEGDARTPSPERVRPLIHIDESHEHPSYTRRASTASSSSDPHRDPSATVPPVEAAHENIGVAPAPRVDRAIERGERERPTADPLALYRTAYDALRAGRHDDAVHGFREFVRLYPRHDYADNAQYWLGECFYDRKQYALAAAEFQKVVARWPAGNKAPDALLKLGYCLIADGDKTKGREILRDLPGTYPRTEAARLAAERLAELKEEPK